MSKRSPENHLSLILAISAVTVLSSSFAVASAPVADNFDTSKIVALKGVVRGVFVPPGIPVRILIDVDTAGSKPQLWLIEGDTLGHLTRAGWTFFSPLATLKLGDKIVVSAYLPKPGSKTSESLPGTSPQTPDELETARVAHGTEVTLPGGRKLPFGPRQ